MDPQMKILHRLYFEGISNEKLLRMMENPVRAFEDDMIEGAIADIGCGQSSTLLDYLESGKELIAVDNEQSQLNYLKKRVESYNPEKLNNWSFICKEFPDETIFDRDYALLIFSHLFHFFTLDENIKIGKLIADKTKSGALIYSRSHSKNHYTNKPDHPNSDDPYFKHFFSVADLDVVFPADKFQRLYYAEIESEISTIERNIQIKWIEEVCRRANIRDRREITQIKRDHFKDQRESMVDAIYRRL